MAPRPGARHARTGERRVTRDEFLVKWRTLLDEFARFDVEISGVKVCGEVLADFEAVITSEDEALLGLPQAATLSGYSSDHLRRLVRTGRLPARRDGRRLFFRAGDLPKKPSVVDARPVRAYDPVADAQRVATRTSHGGSNG